MNFRNLLSTFISIIILSCKGNPVETNVLVQQEVIIFSSNRNSVNRNLFQMDLDGTNLRQLTFFAEGNFVPADISKSGDSILFYDSWSSEPDVGIGIYILNTLDNKITGPYAYGTPGNFSPDGKKFVYTKHIWSGGYDSIWIYDLERGTEKQITKPFQYCCACSYASDGKVIAYNEIDPDHSFYIWIGIMDTSGNEIKRLTLLKEGNYALEPKFLNKGNIILFSYLSLDFNSGYDICMEDINTSEIHVVSNHQQRMQYDDRSGFYHPSTNSNDTKIIFNSMRGDDIHKLNPEIGIMNIDGTGHKRLTKDNYWDSNPVVGNLYFFK